MTPQPPAGEKQTGDRAAFLHAFHQANWSSHRSLHDVGEDQFAVRYAGEADFAATLTALGGVVRTLTGAASLAGFLDDLLIFARAQPAQRSKEAGRVRVAMTDEPECAAVAYALGGRDDVEVVDYTDAAAVATADVGFTGARAAVARTGSIVVDAGRAGGRTVSLLPPIHVALVAASALVAEPGDLWRHLGTPMPSNLVQITGPSRSADIELIITLGVHGPRALWVGLIDLAGPAGLPGVSA